MFSFHINRRQYVSSIKAEVKISVKWSGFIDPAGPLSDKRIILIHTRSAVYNFTTRTFTYAAFKIRCHSDVSMFVFLFFCDAVLFSMSPSD